MELLVETHDMGAEQRSAIEIEGNSALTIEPLVQRRLALLSWLGGEVDERAVQMDLRQNSLNVTLSTDLRSQCFVAVHHRLKRMHQVRAMQLAGKVESNKEGYYLALRQTQGTLRSAAPNWQPWLIFFLRALQQQERRLATKVERERLVIAALPELAIQIIDYVRQHGRVTMADMIRATGASRNTLKDHFRSLVEKRHLAQHGTGKGSWYSLT